MFWLIINFLLPKKLAKTFWKEQYYKNASSAKSQAGGLYEWDNCLMFFLKMGTLLQALQLNELIPWE